MPGLRNRPMANAILRNWRLGGITTLQAGRPFNVGASNNPTAGAGSARADLVGEGYPVLDPNRSKGEKLDAYFDKSRFANPAPNTFGTLGRNALIGPGYANVDASLSKEWRLPFIGEQGYGGVPLRGLQRVQLNASGRPGYWHHEPEFREDPEHGWGAAHTSDGLKVAW